MAGRTIENGTVLIRDGKIAEVGQNLSIPGDAKVVDAQGKFVMPGLVDAMTYFGVRPFARNVAKPVSPENRIVDAYYPFGKFFKGEGGIDPDEELLYGGVTTVYIAPGGGQLISGQGAVVKTNGRSYDSLILRESASIDMTLPPRAAPGQPPPNRMSTTALLRKSLFAAQEFDSKVQTYDSKTGEEKEKATKPPRDLGNEALSRLLNREIPARIEADFVEDIRTAIRVAEEFGFELVIDSGVGAHRLKDLLAEKKIPVVLGKTSHPFPPEYFTYPQELHSLATERNAALLIEAGIKVAIASFASAFGGRGTQGRWLLLEAGLATGHGLSEEDAMKAVTINPAEILGVSDRVGSLEAGKDADLIILDGHPLLLKTWIEQVYIDGILSYEKKDSN
jgi:imidazolonepropionase-like amidohydrolase